MILIKDPFFNENGSFYFDTYETKIFNGIKDKLLKSKCSVMGENQREFLIGIIRKYRPKKIIELGILRGGSSIIILNAIKAIKNSHLYSIDINVAEWIGCCINNYFSHLKDKLTLYRGNITAK